MNGMRCTAKSKRSGVQCKRWAMKGATVCHTHGGKSPQVKRKAAQRRTEQQAREALGRLNITPLDDPLEALRHLGAEAVAWKQQLSDMVAELTSVGYQGLAGEQVRAAVQVYERALARCESVLATIVRLGLDEKLVAIRDRQVQVMAEAVSGALADADLPTDSRRRVIDGVVRRLRVVEAG